MKSVTVIKSFTIGTPTVILVLSFGQKFSMFVLDKKISIQFEFLKLYPSKLYLKNIQLWKVIPFNLLSKNFYEVYQSVELL